MNSRVPEYDLTRLIAWLMSGVSHPNMSQSDRLGLSGVWNLCIDELECEWFNKGFGVWTDYLHQNFEVYQAIFEEMKGSKIRELYQSTWTS